MAYYLGRIHSFALHIGIDVNKIRFRQHLNSEMAHYANECWDLECLTSLVSFIFIRINVNVYFYFIQGWLECVGLADRCDYDLKQHANLSGQDLSIDNKPGIKSFKLK